MGFAPDVTEILARARADVRMGVPIVLLGDSGGLAIAAETVDAARLAEFKKLEACAIAITVRRAQTLKARAYDGDIARINLPKDATLAWINAIADPAGDLRHPMKGPFSERRDGQAELARAAIAVMKDARLLPAALVAPLDDPSGFAAAHGLTAVPIKAALDTQMSPLNSVISARLPLSVAEAGRLHIFRPEDGGEEHYAVEIGQPDRSKPVLSRLHSACFTGDLLGSLKCDCGPQLRGALGQMGAEGAGVLLYLNQEGRANHRLGFEDDERDFRIGAEILKCMGFDAVRLLTNNPAKVARMESCGVQVIERVPLQVGENAHNAGYLATTFCQVACDLWDGGLRARLGAAG